MAIIRWDPFRDMVTLRERMNKLFEDMAASRGEEKDLATSSWAPAVDIYETGHELVVKADLPDVAEKDIDVRVENNTLTIHGERKFEKSVNEENYLRVERSYGTFMRSFSLPNTIQTEGIHAEYKSGVLTVHMPKREESKPKQVKINITGETK